MVKNSSVNQPTDQVRLGIHASSTQPANSIVFNASKEKLTNVKHSGLYVAPIRADEGSNLLAYNSHTKEIVDIGGQKLKLKHLEVENLEVENKTIKNEKFKLYPILDIAENSSNKETGITIHNERGEVNILNDQGRVKIDSNLEVDGKIKALLLEGDGGLLSNIQIQTEVRQHFDNIYVRNELHADGQYLRNIKKSQIIDFENNSHTFDELSVSSLDIKKSLHAEGDVYCTKLYGDGSHLTGIPKLESVEKIKNSIDTRVSEINDSVSNIVKPIQNQIALNKDDISNFKPVMEDVNKLNYKITEIDNIKTDLKVINDICDTHENNIAKNGRVVESQEQNINKINKILETFVDKKEYHDLKSEIRKHDVHIKTTSSQLTNSFEQLNELYQKFKEYDEDKLNYAEKDDYIKIKTDLDSHKQVLDTAMRDVEQKMHDVEQKNFKFLDYYSKTDYILSEINDMCEKIKFNKDQCTNFTNINNLNTANFEDKVQKTNHTLVEHQKILDTHETRVEQLENVKSLKTIPHSINVESKLMKTSRLGEIQAVEVSAPYGKLADICGYTKANNGTTSGNPGGLLFRTMNPQGSLTNVMSLDANGKATIGDPTKKDRNPPAILSLNSTTLGFLPPRMTTEEREQVLNPVPGLIVFDTSTDELCIYKSSGWFCLS